MISDSSKKFWKFHNFWQFSIILMLDFEYTSHDVEISLQAYLACKEINTIMAIWESDASWNSIKTGIKLMIVVKFIISLKTLNSYNSSYKRLPRPRLGVQKDKYIDNIFRMRGFLLSPTVIKYKQKLKFSLFLTIIFSHFRSVHHKNHIKSSPPAVRLQT